jgi:multidrug efflux pump subunit AcrB
MTEIQLVDVTIHIDAELEQKLREEVEKALRHVSGVVSVHMPEDKRHLVTVEYDPEKTKASHLHECVREITGHAELIGL